MHKAEFEMLHSIDFQQVLLALGFKAPSGGQWFWRIPGYLKPADCRQLREEVQQSFSRATD